mmetsp:Transcript_27596/g.65534  ORF Transcript_27596/g.65534 Transcript_27596/m.65534 type:complete len:244 (+) Transcript_27596:193-924(+)
MVRVRCVWICRKGDLRELLRRFCGWRMVRIRHHVCCPTHGRFRTGLHRRQHWAQAFGEPFSRRNDRGNRGPRTSTRQILPWRREGFGLGISHLLQSFARVVCGRRDRCSILIPRGGFSCEDFGHGRMHDFRGQPNCVGFGQCFGGIAQQLADTPADAGVGLAHTVPDLCDPRGDFYVGPQQDPGDRHLPGNRRRRRNIPEPIRLLGAPKGASFESVGRLRRLLCDCHDVVRPTVLDGHSGSRA